MAYVRPAIFNTSDYAFIAAYAGSFPPLETPYVVDHPIRALAVACWDDRAPVPTVGFGVFELVQYKGPTQPGFTTAFRRISLAPGSTNYQQYTVSANLADFNSGYTDFWDADAVLLENGLFAFPPGGLFDLPNSSSFANDGTQSLHGVQEIFEWVPSGTAGSGGGDALPQPCPPMKRPPWPYGGPLGVGPALAGLRVKNSRIVGIGGRSFDFRR